MNKQSIEKLFPKALREHEHYNVFVQLASTEISTVTDFIDILNTLTNADRCPEEFIQHLGELIGFNYLTTLDDKMQRETMKLYSEARKGIGTIDDIKYMATYGDNEGYLGNKLFIPGTFEEREFATVVVPRNTLWTWDSSEWDGDDVTSDEFVNRDGTILIEVTRLNNMIMDRVETVKPAGMLVIYKYVYGNMVEYIEHTRKI